MRGDVCEAASPGAGRVQPSCWKLSSPQWDSECWCLEEPCPQSPFSLPLFLLSIPSCPCSLVHLPHALTSSLFLPKFSFPCHSHSRAPGLQLLSPSAPHLFSHCCSQGFPSSLHPYSPAAAPLQPLGHQHPFSGAQIWEKHCRHRPNVEHYKDEAG